MIKPQNKPKTKKIIAKSKKYVLQLVFNSTLGSFFVGYQLSLLNTTKEKLTTHFQWDDKEKEQHIALLEKVIPISACFGALLAGCFAKYGRKLLLTCTDLLSIIGILVCLLSFTQRNVDILVIGRIICGINIGLNSVIIPVYIREISPVSMSGEMGSYNYVLITLGSLVQGLFGFIFEEKQHKATYLYFIFGFPIFTCLIRLINFTLFIKYDTPTSYIIKKDKSKAIKALEEIYNDEYVHRQYEILLEDTKINPSDYLNWCNITYPLFLCVGLAFFQQIYEINTIRLYSTNIFKQIGGQQSVIFFNIILMIIQCASAFYCSQKIETSGRHQLLLSSQRMIMISLFALVCLECFKRSVYISAIFIVTFTIGFSLGIAPITWIYMADILSVSGVAFVSFQLWTFSAIFSKVFQIITTNYSFLTAFICLFVISLFGIFFMINFIKETAMKSKLEIWQTIKKEMEIGFEKYQNRNNKDKNKDKVKETLEEYYTDDNIELVEQELKNYYQ